MKTTIERSWRLSPDVLGADLLLAMRRRDEQAAQRRALYAWLKLMWLRFVHGWSV
jgi:hypothetical protein